MAYSGVLGPPMVVELGGAQVKQNLTAVVAGGDFSAGDFLRKPSNGGIEIATDTALNSGTGGIEAMAISDYDASEDGAIKVPYLEFTADTVFRQQMQAGTPDIDDINELRTLNLTTGKMAPTDTTTNGLVEIVDLELTKRWWMADEDICGIYGVVYFKFIPAVFELSRTVKST